MFDPIKGTLNIEDIAHSMSMQPRFGGHSKTFYSIAEHSVWVANKILEKGHSKKVAFCGLMHDTTEAYLVDIPKPIKVELPDYNNLEEILMKKLAKRFKFEYPLYKIVKTVDRLALDYEWINVVTTETPDKTMTQPEAKEAFLKLYKKLSPKKKK